MENDKIVKIHGYYGVNNLGDDYILYALLNQIRNNSNNIIVQIDSLSGYKGLNYILEEFPELTFQVIDLSVKRKLTERIKLMYKNDIYIFGGGGLFPICTNLVRMLAFVTCPFFVFQQKNPQNTQERHPQKEG